MKKVGGSTYQFVSTGRTFYANAEVIGIDAAGELHQGYDGSLVATPCHTPEFSFPEAEELANEMIARWEKWRRSVMDEAARAQREYIAAKGNP